MPRKLIRRWLPPLSQTPDTRLKRLLGPIFNDPNLLHLNRGSVSSGVFIGLFCAFLPVPGHIILASLFALVLRGNLPIAVLLVWISNPITIPPLLVLEYKFGQLLLGNEALNFSFEFTWDWFLANGASVYLPVALGGLTAGLFFGTLGYISVKLLWRWKVIKNWQARKDRRSQPPL